MSGETCLDCGRVLEDGVCTPCEVECPWCGEEACHASCAGAIEARPA